GSDMLASRRAAPALSAGGDSTWVRQSADGRFVVFTSNATNLVPGQVDAENTQDIFLRDRVAGTTVLVSHSFTTPSVAAHDQSSIPVISADGSYVAFCSFATDLIPGFINSNGGIIPGTGVDTGLDVFL